MSDINRKPNKNDTWLTPPEWLGLKGLGIFDLDPCCPATMPWNTARRMIHFPAEDGLTAKWEGRVWCNPPYSKPLPWIEKMAAHGKGTLLLPSKSLETKWGQRLLETGDAFLFLAGPRAVPLRKWRQVRGRVESLRAHRVRHIRRPNIRHGRAQHEPLAVGRRAGEVESMKLVAAVAWAYLLLALSIWIYAFIRGYK